MPADESIDELRRRLATYRSVQHAAAWLRERLDEQPYWAGACRHRPRPAPDQLRIPR